MKVYIVVATIGDEAEDILDRVYSHPDHAATRANVILWQRDQLEQWREAASPHPTLEERRTWAAERDVEDLIPWLHSVRETRVEERVVIESPGQYIEYCQWCYRVDCYKPNNPPEMHMRIVADLQDVDVINGRVQRKVTVE